MTRAAAAQLPAVTWDEAPIKIGVSSCLLGNRVRYDGGHKRDAFLVDVLGPSVEWVPVCPELELGLGVPREPIRLEEGPDGVRLVATKSRIDHTTAMQGYAARRVAALIREDLSGYVLKRSSPSCGMERVKVYGAGSTLKTNGRGLFAAAIIGALPHLPVEEEGRLTDPDIRTQFIERVVGYRRLQGFFRQRWTVAGLIAFHTAHKLQLMAHAPRYYQALGRLVAQAKSLPRPELRERYVSAFMLALESRATPHRQVNVLHHILGYLRPHLDADSRAELLALIDDFRAERVALLAPLTLVRHYARRFDIAYLRGQVYLQSHPLERIRATDAANRVSL